MTVVLEPLYSLLTPPPPPPHPPFLHPRTRAYLVRVACARTVGLPAITDIKCGNNHTAAITSEGKLYTWGFGGYGRLGHNTPADQLVPKEVGTFSAPRRGRAGGPQLPPDGASFLLLAAASCL
eukprot:COSAG01_NODE_4850_length_4684_cov_2.069793_2_plen_123_part_00